MPLDIYFVTKQDT